LRLFDTFEDAWLSHQAGVLRLLALQLAEKVNWMYKHPGLSRECQLAWASLAPVEDLVQDLVDSSLAQVAGDCWKVRDAASFEQLCDTSRSRVGGECRKQADILNAVIPKFREIQTALDSRKIRAAHETREDIREQINDMIYAGFLGELEPGHLEHFPRYFAAIDERLKQAAENPQRDLQRMQEVLPFFQRYRQRLESGADYDEALDQFRWLLAEYRVSIFAQRLGTASKVSAKRLKQAWRDVVE
jgi:ATP-dependent helicase HrpA